MILRDFGPPVVSAPLQTHFKPLTRDGARPLQGWGRRVARSAREGVSLGWRLGRARRAARPSGLDCCPR